MVEKDHIFSSGRLIIFFSTKQPQMLLFHISLLSVQVLLPRTCTGRARKENSMHLMGKER